MSANKEAGKLKAGARQLERDGLISREDRETLEKTLRPTDAEKRLSRVAAGKHPETWWKRLFG